MDPRYYTVLNDDLRAKLDDVYASIEDNTELIIETDGRKTAYDDIILSLDRDIFNEVQSVNFKIIDVSNAYQDRINVGCRTDLFWRLTGVGGTEYSLVATQLSLVGYAGTLPSVEVLDGTTVGFVTYSNNSTFGFSTESAYGVKYYNEPVTEDLEDTFVTSFIGTISTGSNQLVALSVVGSSSKNTTLIAVRSDSTSVSAPSENSARLTIASGGQLSRTELPRGHTLLIHQIEDNAIEVAIKGENGSEISSASLTAFEDSPATEVTLAISELGAIVATTSDVEPVPVRAPSTVNFTPGKKKPVSPTTTTDPSSIEIALPG